MEIFPQVTINVSVKSKPPITDYPEITDSIKKAQAELGEKGRVLVRYSGTQSVCRVMVEGPTQQETKRLAGAIAETIKNRLG